MFCHSFLPSKCHRRLRCNIKRRPLTGPLVFSEKRNNTKIMASQHTHFKIHLPRDEMFAFLPASIIVCLYIIEFRKGLILNVSGAAVFLSSFCPLKISLPYSSIHITSQTKLWLRQYYFNIEHFEVNIALMLLYRTEFEEFKSIPRTVTFTILSWRCFDCGNKVFTVQLENRFRKNDKRIPFLDLVLSISRLSCPSR